MRTPRTPAALITVAALAAFSLTTAPTVAAPHEPAGHEYGSPEDLGPLIESVAALDTAYGSEDGRPVMYTTTNGSPALFQVLDLASNELLRSFPLPGTSSSWSHTVDANGDVVVASSGKLFRYTPGAAEIVDLGAVPGAVALYGTSSDAEGNLYVGTYPDGRVVRVDAETGEYRDYGTVQAGQDYVRALDVHDGTIYAGTGTVGSLWAIDVETGEKTEIPFPERPEYEVDALPQIYGMNRVGDLLFLHVSRANLLMAYDTAAGEWSDTVVPGYRGLFTSPEHEGETWLVADGRVQAFDLATHGVRDTGIRFGTYLRHSAWVDVSAENPDLPGVSLVTVQYGGMATFINPATSTVVTRPTAVAGQPVSLQGLETGPDGAIYASAYMGTAGARFDPGTGDTVNFPLGQAEGMTPDGDSMLFGLYPGAGIEALDTTTTDTSPDPVPVHDIGADQDRPFAMTSGDGYAFVGTVPTYGALDGALSIRDPLGTWATYPGIVDDQSVIGVAYADGVVYGSTSVWGGLGAEPTQSEAHVFAVDVTTGEKLLDVVPDLPGDIQPKAIGSLSMGPDGLLWGAAWGTIFAMDPHTLEVVKSREIFSTDWSFSHLWRPVYLEWAHGMLYTTLGSTLTVVDPETLEHQTLVERAALMTVGADGHLYYGAGTNLMRIQVTPAGTGVVRPARPERPEHPLGFDRPDQPARPDRP